MLWLATRQQCRPSRRWTRCWSTMTCLRCGVQRRRTASSSAPPRSCCALQPAGCVYGGMWSFFGKLIGFIAPETVPWLSKKSEDQSGGPRTNLKVFGDELSFQYLFFQSVIFFISRMEQHKLYRNVGHKSNLKVSNLLTFLHSIFYPS